MITFKVPSEMYGITDCVITDMQRTLKTGYAPCGSGEDYKLTSDELQQLHKIVAGDLRSDEFIHTEKPKYNIIRTHNPQHITLLQVGEIVVMDGKFTPGKSYTIKCDNRAVNARCTSWFQDACIKSSFVKI